MLRLSLKILALSVCSVVSSLALSSRADSLTGDTPFIKLSFTGTVSAVNAPITPQVGDSFLLSLTFWRTDAAYAKSNPTAYSNYTARGAYSEQLLVNGVSYFGGQDFTSFDTFSSLSLDNNTLSFLATDQGYGVHGSTQVGGDFPSVWFADIRTNLPNGANQLDFSALGNFDYFYGLRGGLPSLSGNISAGTVELWGGAQSGGSVPVPEVGSLLLLLPVSLMLLQRRRSLSSLTN